MWLCVRKKNIKILLLAKSNKIKIKKLEKFAPFAAWKTNFFKACAH